MAELDERAAVLALVKATKGEWFRTAALIEDAGSARRLLEGTWTGLEPFEIEEAEQLAREVSEDDLKTYRELIEQMEAEGTSLITVLDDAFPVNLRQIYNRPPFLFVQGQLQPSDDRAVAVVGTRTASTGGLRKARDLAAALAREGVTVLSGLAVGIDAAAHRATLRVGGRTVAVMGTGIRRMYPTKNAVLADQIRERGALVSQFWPDAPPTKYSFPMRNVVMSGMAVGTVVIEASDTSGAKMQARLALEHGKRLFLLESLVTKQDWAKKYADHAGATVVRSVDDIVDVLVSLARPVKQLRLA